MGWRPQSNRPKGLFGSEEPTRCSMHGYSTDSDEKRVVPLFLAGLAIALAWVASKLLASVHFPMPWWADAPSSMFFYGTLYALFDRRLWRHPLLRKLGLVKTPNLAGRWQGYLTSSFDNHTKRYDLCVQIFQSWTQISVFLSTTTSASWSCVAVIQVADPEGVALIYQYENQPLADATTAMHIHFGTAILRMLDGNRLTGDYYGGRDRGTFGRISCRRLPVTLDSKLIANAA
jgi:predicted pore-forming effector associated with SMODS systems